MEFNISAQHTELTPSLEEAVKEKFTRFQDHADKPLQTHVVLRIDSGQHVVDAKVTGLGKTLVASATHKDMYAAINEVSHLLDRQWRKQKTARLSQRRKGNLRDLTVDMTQAPAFVEQDTPDYEAWVDDEPSSSSMKP